MYVIECNIICQALKEKSLKIPLTKRELEKITEKTKIRR